MTNTVNIDDISTGIAILPPGRYAARALPPEGKISKSGNPMIVASFVVARGEHEGLEAKIWYSLTVSQKDGKKFAGGVMEAKSAFAAIGKPLPAGFAFPAVYKDDPNLDEKARQEVANAAALLYAKRFKGIEVEILVSPDGELKDSDGNTRLGKDGKPLMRTRTTVVGLAQNAVRSEPSVLDDFDFGDE